jgi:pantoate--beta-alanine ligase
VPPRIVTSIEATREAVAAARKAGATIGLVPTMGALHDGHLSLIRAARRETGFVVVSLFVNPTQFGPKEDLSRYPRPFADDVARCADEKVDLILYPEPETMYPPGFQTYVEVTELQKGLCGAARPGHFRGVATVVLKLLNIVQPDTAYFGQKDAQQARIIEQMVSDLNVPVTIRVCPIVRAADGLALSSRNQYLDPDQRRRARVLHDALAEAAERVAAGERDADALLRGIRERIAASAGARLDYAVAVDAASLRPVQTVDGPTLVAVAVFFGTTRLIDNVVVNGE